MHSICKCINNARFIWLRSQLLRTVENASAAQTQPYSWFPTNLYFTFVPKLNCLDMQQLFLQDKA